MKINKEYLKARAKEKTTYLSLLGIIGSVFGISFVVPVDLLAEVIALAAAGVISGAGVTLESSNKSE